MFENSLVGLCNGANGRVDHAGARPAIDYRCPVDAVPGDPKESYERMQKLHKIATEGGAANNSGARQGAGSVVDATGIETDTRDAPMFSKELADKLRPGATAYRSKKKEYRNLADDKPELPVVAPAPPPKGWVWHGCGGALDNGSETHSVAAAKAWTSARVQLGERLPSYATTAPDRSGLNTLQKNGYDQFEKQLQSGEQVLGTIYGSAGTGKSHFTRQVMSLFGEHLHPGEVDDPVIASARSLSVLAGAGSGVAAKILGGSTVHSLFMLKYTREGKKTGVGRGGNGEPAKEINQLTDLTEPQIVVLKSRIGAIEALFVDEFSFLDSEMLADMETRFQAHCASGREYDGGKPFGGLVHIVFIGDPSQLPPVFGSNICGKSGSRGQAAYQAALRGGVVVELSEQIRHAISGQDDVSGVFKEWWFQRGAPCVITRNVYVEGGIVNGQMGWYFDLGWEAGEPENPSKTPPDVVLVLVPEKDVGIESFCPCPAGYKVVCFNPLKSEATVDKYESRGESLGSSGGGGFRFGFGIRSGFALTQYKCQGQTLFQTVAHWAAKVKPGADYASFSRAIATAMLLLGERLFFNRLKRIGYDKTTTPKPARKALVAARIGQIEDIHRAAMACRKGYTPTTAMTLKNTIYNAAPATVNAKKVTISAAAAAFPPTQAKGRVAPAQARPPWPTPPARPQCDRPKEPWVPLDIAAMMLAAGITKAGGAKSKKATPGCQTPWQPPGRHPAQRKLCQPRTPAPYTDVTVQPGGFPYALRNDSIDDWLTATAPSPQSMYTVPSASDMCEHMFRLGLCGFDPVDPQQYCTDGAPPEWIGQLFERCTVKATVVDYYGLGEVRGNVMDPFTFQWRDVVLYDHTSKAMYKWLKWLGVDLGERSYIKRLQEGYTCGFVAADVVSQQHATGGAAWFDTLDPITATHTATWEAGFAELGKTVNTGHMCDDFEVAQLVRKAIGPHDIQPSLSTGAPFHFVETLRFMAMALGMSDSSGGAPNVQGQAIQMPTKLLMQQHIPNTSRPGTAGHHWFNFCLSIIPK
jgi:hypothetical protein